MRFLKSCGLIIALAFSLAITNSWAAEVYPDEFNGPGIHQSFNWQKEPPDWDVGETTAGWLHIGGVFGGNLWCTDESARLYQEIGDEPFEIETHMKAVWGTNSSEIAGICAKSPGDDNWVKLKLWMHGGGTAQIQFQKKCVESGDGLMGQVPGFNPTGGETEVWLKLKRDGEQCTSYYKTSEGEDWIEIGVTSFPFSPPYEVGIYGGVDVGAAELIVEFDYFRDNTSPFTLDVSPESGLASCWGRIKARK